jgi:uncharacterized membrane protein
VAAGITVVSSILLFLQQSPIWKVSYLIVVGFIATVAVGVGIPFARDIPMFSLFPFSMIALVQSVFVTFFCVWWVRKLRNEAAEAERKKADDEKTAIRTEEAVADLTLGMVSSTTTKAKRLKMEMVTH